MRRDVRGRVVLVTGASRGIGRRLAERLAKCGATVALTARSADDLTALASELNARGATAAAFPGDLTQAADRERIIAGVVEKFGRLDVLVNCAGVCSFGEFATSREEIVRRVLEVNFFAPAELTRLAVPPLIRSAALGKNGWRPAVVNVASICGRWGIPSMSEHCASKHALVGMTEALRAEFERYGIDVLLVLPGLVRSDDLQKHLLRNEGKIHLNFEGAQPSEEVADAVLRSLLTNRAEKAVGFAAWWVWFAARRFPRVVRFVMHRKVWNHQRREQRTSNE